MTPASMPAQLGRYKLLRPLGQGGMGAVFVALDTRLNREVALKFPLVNAESNPIAIERFEREARLAASIKHPNFCTVYDVGEDQGYHYYVMEIVPGQPLTNYLRNGQPWPLDQAAYLIASLASALAELHARGIVHRDLKPPNVMVKPDGNVVLMDFGLARTFEGTSDGLTATGQSLGTPAYMAPEQAMNDGKSVGPAADVWALGVMLYQLVGGCLPFTGSGLEVFGRILHMQPSPPSSHRPDSDTRLDAICLQALSKEAHKRPASMQTFAAALTSGVQGSVPQPVPAIVPESAALLDMPTRAPSDDGSQTQTAHPVQARELSETMVIKARPGPARRLPFTWTSVVGAVIVSMLGFIAVLAVVLYSSCTGEPNSHPNSGANSDAIAVEKIRKLGGIITLDANHPDKPVVSVDLSDTQVTDADLKVLRELKQLKELYLQRTKVTDAGLKELKELKQLTMLTLSYTKMTDAGLKELKELKQLTYLNLYSTEVTDEGLKELKDFRQLQFLLLRSTKVTTKGVADLKKALPDCQIDHSLKP